MLGCCKTVACMLYKVEGLSRVVRSLKERSHHLSVYVRYKRSEDNLSNNLFECCLATWLHLVIGGSPEVEPWKLAPCSLADHLPRIKCHPQSI